MTKRFREFSRLYWEIVRPKPKPRLHPTMRARMWKPGQSGNPLGRKAYAEAMGETSEQPVELSAGAKRTRRWREKREQGVVVVHVDVASDVAGKLVGLGWLDPARRGDRTAIATALIELARRATGAGAFRSGRPAPRRGLLVSQNALLNVCTTP